MSEHDNLQDADGKNKADLEKNDAVETHDIQSDTADAIQAESEKKTEKLDSDAIELKHKVEASIEDDAEDDLEVETEAEVEDKIESEDEAESESKTGEDHVDEIEASNAEDAEDESNAERHTIEDKDYSTLSMEKLVQEMEGLLKHHKVQNISKKINEIKSEFNSKFSALLEEKKEEFIEAGGNIIDFYYTSDAKKNFGAVYKKYKHDINAYYNDREKQLKENLKNRLEIIENIKGLLNVEEHINTTYKTFKDLQEQWRNAGPIPRDKYNNAWNTYHHHVERFYDFLHLNRDLRDMDFKHNYEQKLKIIEQAEALAQDNNINRAFRELQVLHKLWKEELGPVAQEFRETIWERFSEATKAIHDKRQEYYADLDKAHEKNLEKKEAIIEQIHAVNKDESNSHGAWQKKIKQIEALREEFFNAGKVPLKKNEATWTKFKSAVRDFNRNKNKFYKNLKKDQYDNLQKKLDLIKVAEDNKDSDDFETVTPLMKRIQNEWKKIGHVPRKDSDKIWKQFKNACNAYFDKLHAEKKAENQELYDNFDKKSALLDEIKAFETTDDAKADIETLKAKVNAYRSIGYVPQNKRFIDGKFNKAIDGAFAKLDVDKSKLEMIRFDNKLKNLSQGEDTRLLDNEQNFIRKRIDEIKGEITQLENNLQFFSNVDDDNPLVKDVHKNIANHKKDLETWKSKLKKVRDMYA
ncbi:DUF349 domain-containing protein [Winogradskyella maritima]|uniref:DUF349 domain-containing protein n=1 Tax=Winogradskyella maritima TaxID=1517766 RepID=A0ABV8AJJ6_9FLAO|nr:DUF349 domain-containing protein [Winogradskyella maritima]